MTSELPVIYPPHPNPRRPVFELPANTCDAHFHVFGPPDRFPYADTRVYTPPAAPLEHFLNLMEILGTERGVVVTPNAHGLDNTVSLDAIARAGGRFRGVAKVDDTCSDEDLQRLHDGGMRGIRFNLIAELGGQPNLPMYERVMARVAPLGWSVTFHMLPPVLIEIADWIRSIEIPVIIDHFARVSFADGVGQKPYQVLLELAAEDHVWVKISCAERLSAVGPPYEDALPFAHALVEVAPDRLLWGTDWPHTQRYGPGEMCDDGDLVDLLPEMIPDEAILKRTLVDNPATLFRFDRF
jgi:predicted TIM-barrel fold metal-dependent hydrolase